MSSHIKGSGILPIQDYLKLGNGMIQKEVTASFIKFDCPDATEEILVEEKVLYDLVNATNSDTITITSVKRKTTISDKRDTISMQVPEVSLFVDIQSGDLEKYDLSANFLEAIGSAAQVCNPMSGTPDKYMYVMAGNKAVTGITQSSGYCRIIEEEVIMSLEKKVASFVSNTNAHSCSITESHYIFYTVLATVGFAKQEVGYGDFAKPLKADPGELTFTASNSDLKSYNSLAISLCQNNPIVTMAKGALKMYDSMRDISQDRPLEGIKPYENFTYAPDAMNLLLSALGDEELDFYQKDHMMLIRSKETNSIAAIGKIKK